MKNPRLDDRHPKVVPCEMTSDFIRYNLKAMQRRDTHPAGRLMLWRLIIRAAQGEYDRELAEMDSLNSVKADAALEVPIA